MTEHVPGYPCTSSVFDGLPRPPLTADEARMISELHTLDKLMQVALFDEEHDDAVELMDRSAALGKRLDESRARTWRVWRDNLEGDNRRAG